MNKVPISRKSFIRLAAMLGAGSAMASVLSSACGGGGQSTSGNGDEQSTRASGGSGETTIAQAAGPSVGSREAISQESEVPINSALAFTDSDLGQPGVLVHLSSGDFVAYSAVCTHQGCTVSYQPQTQQLVCPCHGSIFDPARDGAVVQGPAATPLARINTETQNGEVNLT